jgi:hypothetical protein
LNVFWLSFKFFSPDERNRLNGLLSCWNNRSKSTRNKLKDLNR